MKVQIISDLHLEFGSGEFNYHVGKTNVICNPHGYINERFNGFDRELILEI